jgi:3-oxoacyl-[acyl-carrier protein] reductase
VRRSSREPCLAEVLLTEVDAALTEPSCRLLAPCLKGDVLFNERGRLKTKGTKERKGVLGGRKEKVFDLSGKKAVVTGASRGIGEACARHLDRRGATVALLARNTEAMVHIAEELTHEPVVLTADLSREEDVLAVTRQVLACLGTVDILVNNAGLAWSEPPEAITPDRLDLQFSVNIRNLILLTSLLGPALIASRGSVVNVSSVAAYGGDSEEAVYAATKGAVNAWTSTLGAAWAARGVRVNGVAPGLIDTEIWEELFREHGGENLRSVLTGNVPMGRWGTADEIAGVVCFLCSDEASYITGQTIRVDGGLLVRPLVGFRGG